MIVASHGSGPSGPLRFARFAMPPQHLGYCGPSGDSVLAGEGSSEHDSDIRELARSFEGAYPYLRLLAGANGTDDPLAADVVEAYWIGNRLLNKVSDHDFGRSIDDRFRRRAGSQWERIGLAVPGGVANHAFHVMNVMPWAGLMRDGIVDEPLGIIDHCRISWAVVLAPGEPTGSGVLIRRIPLDWDGSRLVYAPPVVEVVESSIDVTPGDVVAVHWNWICERLTPTQLGTLRWVTDQQMAVLRAS